MHAREQRRKGQLRAGPSKWNLGELLESCAGKDSADKGRHGEADDGLIVIFGNPNQNCDWRPGFKKPDAKKPGTNLVIPKPINLPSRRKENNGFDPNIQLVSGGSWGSGTQKPSPASTGFRPTVSPAATVSQKAAPQSQIIPAAISGWPARSTVRDESIRTSDFPALGEISSGQSREISAATGKVDDAWSRDDSPIRSSFQGRKEDPLDSQRGEPAGREWGEADEDEMDFNKPIVIKTSEATNALKYQSALSDPREEARILAKKKQLELERMQEELIQQQRMADMEAMERERRAQEEEERRRREADFQRNVQDDSRKKYLEQREEYRRRDFERAYDRRDLDRPDRISEDRFPIRRWQEEDRSKEMPWKLEEDSRTPISMPTLENENVFIQNQYMKQSVEAAKIRRQQEEERIEAERKAAAEARLAELERRRQERDVEARRMQDEGDRAEPFQRNQQMEFLSTGQNKSAEQELPVRPNPWNRLDQTISMFPVQEQNLHDQEREDLDLGSGDIGDDIEKPSSHAQYSAWSRDRPNEVRGPRKLYDPKKDRYGELHLGNDCLIRTEIRSFRLVSEDEASSFGKKTASEKDGHDKSRKEKDSKVRDKETDADRALLKKQALEERRKRERENTKKTDMEVSDGLLSLDASRAAAAKGKVQIVRRPNAAVIERKAVSNGSGVERGQKAQTKRNPVSKEDIDADTMPITSEWMNSSVVISTGSSMPSWNPSYEPLSWSSQPSIAGAWSTTPSEPLVSPSLAPMFGDGREDATDVAKGTADFILDGDDEGPTPEKQDSFPQASNLLANPYNPNTPDWGTQTSGWNAPGGGWDGLNQKVSNYEAAFSAGQFKAPSTMGFSFLQPLTQEQVWSDASHLLQAAPASLFSEIGLDQNVTLQWSAEQLPSTWSAPSFSLAGRQSKDMNEEKGGNDKSSGGMGSMGKSKLSRESKQTPRKPPPPKRIFHQDASGMASEQPSPMTSTGSGVVPVAGRGVSRGGRGGFINPVRGKRIISKPQGPVQGEFQEAFLQNEAANANISRRGGKVIVPQNIRKAAQDVAKRKNLGNKGGDQADDGNVV
eukprot:759496-Hanusia_phi.AAC.3